MRLVCVMLLSAFSGRAAALHPAKNLSALTGDLKAIKSLSADLDARNAKLRRFEIRLGLRDDNEQLLKPGLPDTDHFEYSRTEIETILAERRRVDENARDALQRLPSEDYGKFVDLKREIGDIHSRLRSHCSGAIASAIVAYGIAPRVRKDPIVNGPPPSDSPDAFPSFHGRDAVWAPLYKPNASSGNLGMTGYDGRITISLGAFRHPGLLALTIYHETLHFEELFDAAVDLRNDPESEVRIRTAVKPLLESVFDLEQEDIKRHEEFLKKEVERAERWRELIQKGFDPWDKRHRPVFGPGHRPLWMGEEPSPLEELETALEVFSQEGADRADPLGPFLDALEPVHRAVVRELSGNDQSRAEWEERQRRLKAQEEYLASLEAGRYPPWEALKTWASAACAYVEPVERVPIPAGSTDFDYLGWALVENERRSAEKGAADALRRRFLLTHFSVMQKSEILRRLKEEKKALRGCRAKILRVIADAPGPVDVDWLVAKLEHWKGGGWTGSAFRALARAVRRGGGAVLAGIQRPFVAIGKFVEESAARAEARAALEAPGRQEPVRDEQSPPEIERRSPRTIWQGSPTMDKLRGIAGGTGSFP